MLVKKLNKDLYTPIGDPATDQGLRCINVTVVDPTGQTSSAFAYRSDDGGSSQPIGVDTTIVTWVGCNLRLGSTGQSVAAGTHITNHAEDQ
ncbi:MAG: hypothetical protein R3C02_14995 [Planctomycetaceae bacterium]